MSSQPMSPKQIALVRSSWQQLLPIQDRAAELFYGRLFEMDPSLARLFRGDMAAQGRKLMTMIGMVVARLDRLGEIVPAVEHLGRRHSQYGVEPAHYDTVGAALLGTLRAGLGDVWSPAAEEAWAAAYGTLASVMLRASVDARVGHIAE